MDVILDDLHHGIHEVFKYSDTTQDLTCTALVVVRSGHHTITRAVNHLGLVESSKQVQMWKPYPEHSDHSSEVVRELKERDSRTEQAAREVTKRTLESTIQHCQDQRRGGHAMGRSFRVGWVSDELL